jgi:murein DD-endopeptidase MepM/ murein hydrolase activator NlpD
MASGDVLGGEIMTEVRQDAKFSTRTTHFNDDSMNGIQASRAQRSSDIESFRRGGEERKYTDELQKQISFLETIEKRTKFQNKLLAEAKKLYDDISENIESNVINYEELLNSNKEIANLNKKIADEKYFYDTREANKIKNKKEKEEELLRIQQERNDSMNEYNELLDDTEKKMNTLKNSNKSMLDAFSNNMDKLRTEIKDLAIIKGVGDISAGLFGNGNTSMLAAYSNTRSQLGVTASEFNRFKNDLTKQLRDTGNMFEFGWKDTADYIAKLGELNITSQEMAQEQYLAVIQGTKYLGLQTETQAKVLKIAKDTGRMDLLQSTNETLVQIMNAQLGVTKDQLNLMVNQAADLADMSVFLGGNGDAVQMLTKIQAAVTREYGKSTSDAAMNILSEIMSNPANNQYLMSGFLGENYSQIVNLAQSGQMDEAIKLIISSVKESKSTQVARENIYAANALGADNNIMAIANSEGDMGDVNKNMSDINNASNDIATTIKEFNKSWSDKLVNFGSNLLSMLPFSEFITLQNAYYAVAGITMLVKLPAQMKSIITLLGQIAKSSAIGATGLDTKNPGGLMGILSSKLSPLVAIAAGVASIAMFFNDAKSGKNKADDWGTGESAAAIGGFLGGTDDNGLMRTLKNAGKYALAGAAIGSIFPGIGNVAGWVIGGLIGLVAGGITGGIGGKNIAQGIDSIFGERKDTGGATPPIVSAPSRKSYSGRGAPMSSDAFPWTLTSKFGYRGVIQTSAGPTNPFHSGIDLAHPDGTPIGANNAGTVASVGTASDGANYVIINSGDGYEQIYWHLNQPSHLKKGQPVNEGQLVGYMGMTGHATGPHLHFGMRKAGTSNYVDPISMMNSGVFYPSENGYSNVEINQNKEGTKLLEKAISADTLSDQAKSVAYTGIGDSEGIINSVDRGFAGLNEKLEELSNRQDNQEAVLKQLTNRQSSSVYQY